MKGMERKSNGYGIKLSAKCSNCMLILLNVFYSILALLMLAAGGFFHFTYLYYGLKFEYNLISIAWIVSGAVLLFVSVFGIIGACKKSVAWTNIYGIFMMIAFVIQLSAAIVGFTCISKSESIARHTLDRLISSHSFFEPSAPTMDYMQTSFQCCGIDGPYDWGSNWKYNVNNNNYYERASTVSPSPRTPASCCAPDSSYDNLRCEKPFQKGCLGKMYELTLQVILTIDSIALAIAVIQIVGIVSAFVVAKMIRRMKSNEAVAKDKHKTTIPRNENIFEQQFLSSPPYINTDFANISWSYTDRNPTDNLINEPTVNIISDNTPLNNNNLLEQQAEYRVM